MTMTTNANAPREIWVGYKSIFFGINCWSKGWYIENQLPDLDSNWEEKHKYILFAEHEALLEEKERVRLANIDCVDWYNQIREENKALQQQVETLTKDAERLNFLISEECQVWEVNQRFTLRHITEAYDFAQRDFVSARDAIDAAIQQSKG